MPRSASYILAWSSSRRAYELYEGQGGDALDVIPGTPVWSEWMNHISSFAFRGQNGSYTARQERKQRGGGYWYAYTRVAGKLTKRYLGRGIDLTLPRLELTAQDFRLDPPTALRQQVGRASALPQPASPAPREESVVLPAYLNDCAPSDDNHHYNADYLLDETISHVLATSAFEGEAEANTRLQSVLEGLVLLTLAFEVQGNRTEALVTLNHLLSLAELEGYPRLVPDEGPPILAFLHLAQQQNLLSAYVAKILATASKTKSVDFQRQAPQYSSLVEPLTAREREVLRFVLEGAPNREIARQLTLSVNTVKKHVLNIYGKLNVQNRAQAITKARMLHLP
jgi:DNA-binding NarL/FixJ family response regulator